MRENLSICRDFYKQDQLSKLSTAVNLHNQGVMIELFCSSLRISAKQAANKHKCPVKTKLVTYVAMNKAPLFYSSGHKDQGSDRQGIPSQCALCNPCQVRLQKEGKL